MQQTLLKRTTIYCVVFFLIAMAGMCYFDANKIIVIADSGEGTKKKETEEAQELHTQYRLLLKEDGLITDRFIIPLQEGIMAEDVQIQNHYIDNELWIGIKGAGAEFYNQEYITGNLKNILYGGYDILDGVLWMKFSMKGTYEFESTMNNNKLTIKPKKPKEVYDKIIVIDAGHGGEDKGFQYGRIKEKDLALKISLLLQEKLKDSDIKVYYTRTDDSDVSDEKRIALVNGVDADMLISIHLSYEEDEEKRGIFTVYNGDYFIQDFNSIMLADILEKQVANSTGSLAGGLLDATKEDALIEQAKIPAAQLCIGYLSNEEETDYLTQHAYQELIAEGIYQAIMEIYKENIK